MSGSAATLTRLEYQSVQHFPAPISPGSMEKVCQGYVPVNTSKSTNWSLRVFNAWREERNKCSLEQCPDNLLKEPNSECWNYWLSRFVIGARRADGKPYPPATINIPGSIALPSPTYQLGSSVQTSWIARSPSFGTLLAPFK